VGLTREGEEEEEAGAERRLPVVPWSLLFGVL